MCIARLPVELLLTIFDGLPLGDILWLSRTCKALRRVVFENRTAWKNASDVRRLPLPQGYTIDTVALYQLPLLAARAVSLSKKFTSWQSVFPKRVKSYPRMRTDVLPAFRGAAEPRLLPGARWFFTMEDRGLMLRPIIGIGTYMLNTTGRILSYQWKAAEGATSILVVTLSNRLEQDYMVARYLEYFRVTFDLTSGCTRAQVARAKSVVLPQASEAEHISCIKNSITMLCGYNDILLYDHETDRRLRLHPILDSHGADVPIFNNTVHLLPELSCLLLEKRPSLENGFGGGTGLWTVLSHSTPPLPSMDQPIQLDGTYQWPTLPIQPHVELFQTSRHSIYHFLESDAASTTSLPRAPASTRLYFAPRPATNGRTMNTYASSPVLPLSFLDLPDDAGLKWTASGLPVAVSCNSRSPSISLKFSPITGLAAANYCASLKIPQLFQHSWSLDVFDEVHGMAVATTATQVFVIQF